jgi:hypothetical protein
MVQDSSVSIVTCNGLDCQGIESQWGVRFSAPIQTGPGAHPASYTVGTGSFLGVKRPVCGIDHPPPSSTKVKKRVELYLYSPLGPAWFVLGWTLLFWTLEGTCIYPHFLKLCVWYRWYFYLWLNNLHNRPRWSWNCVPSEWQFSVLCWDHHIPWYKTHLWEMKPSSSLRYPTPPPFGKPVK